MSVQVVVVVVVGRGAYVDFDELAYPMLVLLIQMDAHSFLESFARCSDVRVDSVVIPSVLRVFLLLKMTILDCGGVMLFIFCLCCTFSRIYNRTASER